MFVYIHSYVCVSLGGYNLVYLLCWEVELWYATYPDLNLQLCARVTPGSFPGVGLGLRMYNRSG